MTTRADFFEHTQECMICKELLKKNESRFPETISQLRENFCITGYNLVVAVWWSEDNTEEE